MESKLKKSQKSQVLNRHDFARFLFLQDLNIKQIKEIINLPSSVLTHIRTRLGLPHEKENLITRKEMEQYFELGLSMKDISRATNIPYEKIKEASNQYGLKKFRTTLHPEEIVQVAKLIKEGHKKTAIAKNMKMTVRQVEFMEPYIHDLDMLLNKS
jgi:Asp-tRNA(Asn)/Glu-tRNA(Gln) amidotransferase B subunit